jgi:hypothetical protein
MFLEIPAAGGLTLSPLRRTICLLLLTLSAAGLCRAQEATPTATPASNDAATEKVFTREEVTKPAVIVSMPDPVYFNDSANSHDRAGTVKVSVVLSASGRVSDVQILEGLSQHQNFASLKAAWRIKFIPAIKDGVPVSQSFIASYGFKTTYSESGKSEELKGLKKFYIDTGRDREALGYLTGELQKKLPQLVIVDSPEEAECILSVGSGRGWVFKPTGTDKRRILLYYVGITVKEFARGVVYEYKKANGTDN